MRTLNAKVARYIFLFGVTLMLLEAPLALSQNLVSHWTMNNPDPPNGFTGPWANTVAGGPNMVYDAATQAPSVFNPNETRLEVNGNVGLRTRIAAQGAALNSNSFSFSLIMDPTDIIPGFVTILNKESQVTNDFPDFVRVGWQVQHTGFGNLEFVVRGTQPAYDQNFALKNEFFGNLFVLSTPDPVGNPSLTNRFPEGQDFADETLYQIAGGYNSTTGDMFFYATRLDGPVTQLYEGNRTGHLTKNTPGAVQDSAPLSLGSKKMGPGGVDNENNGAGFDAADLQIYDSLLSVEQLLFLANNPGLTINDMAVSLPGDFNVNGVVDAADYVLWRNSNGTSNALPNDNGLGTPIGPAHFNLWRAHFGQTAGSGVGSLANAPVPEPGTLLAYIGSVIFAFCRMIPRRR